MATVPRSREGGSLTVRVSDVTENLTWTELDDRAVADARALAADAVQKAGSGHPGTAMALAPSAYLIFQRMMRHDPSDPNWLARDRFVLSCGHSSLTLYIQLFYSGYGLTMEDLESFRTWGSLTPGHPEYGHTRGVETTTGPLGQGLATAVGMAMAERFQHGLLTPHAPFGSGIFDHHIYCIASDGDMEEGITSEASSLAGRQELGSLIVLYDNNRISIEGDTHVAFNEDTAARYESYGWHVQKVHMSADGDVDIPAIYAALCAARNETDRPSLIDVRSMIAWPAPHARNTAASHGAPLGDEEVRATKIELNLDPDKDFQLSPGVLDHVRGVEERGRSAHASWQKTYEAWRGENPAGAKLLDRLLTGKPPADLASVIPTFEVGTQMATRKASGQTINAIAKVMPEFWGGSADLAESNLTEIEGGGSFLPSDAELPNATPYGRILHFGIREHAMGAALNGIALEGLTRPFGGTFFVFSDYMRGAVRLSALMDLPVTYVWTHDSIGLGEDGPTHQPIEHLWSLRAMPQLAVVRPADAHETALAWQATLERRDPVGLVLTRQNVPVVSRAAVTDVARGAYVLSDCDGTPDVLLLGTGSEVQLALAAQATLANEAIKARVVSLPCIEWFEEQDAAYKESVLPAAVQARVSIEAGATLGWWKYIGTHGKAVGLDHFGASAAAGVLFNEFGLTADAVVTAAKASIMEATQ